MGINLKRLRSLILKFLKNGGLFAILIAVTFFIVFKNLDMGSAAKAIEQAKWQYMLFGLFAAMIFISCEAVNLRRLLRFFGYDVSMLGGYKYAFIGFFFSAVTPSASGGQPMQLYYMKKEGIDISHGTLCLLIELCSFQLVGVSLGFVGLILKGKEIAEQIGNLKLIFFFGVSANIILLMILMFAIFSTKGSAKAVRIIEKILKKLKVHNVDKKIEHMREQLVKYHQGAAYIKQSPKFVAKVIGTTTIQLISINSIPFFVYLALGGSTMGTGEHGLLDVISLQAILYVTVSAIPLPGAVGISESGFVILFRHLFSASLIGTGTILSRLINFYILVVITGIAILFFDLKRNRSLHMRKTENEKL